MIFDRLRADLARVVHGAREQRVFCAGGHDHLATVGHQQLPVLSEIVDAAIAISGADFGTIQLLEPKSSDEIAAQRGFPQWWLDFFNAVPKGMGSCGTALERGERVIVEDVEQSPIFRGTPAIEMPRRAGVRAVQSPTLFPFGKTRRHLLDASHQTASTA